MSDPVHIALAHVRTHAVGAPLPPDMPVTLQFHPDAPLGGQTMIDSLLRDGVYRSQFETGTSNGGLTAHPGGGRWQWESRIFGTAYDACAGEDIGLRPKYGALNHRNDPYGGSPRFGSCHLRLHAHVLARTTFCYPDSHMQPDHFGVAERMNLITLAERNAAGLEPLDDYIEAHVHGHVRMHEDVQAIVLDPCYRNTFVQEQAEQLPCALEWHKGFRLPMDQLAQCRDYRNADAVAALRSLGKADFVTAADIGTARANGMDYQLAKWAWHCVARFGRD